MSLITGLVLTGGGARAAYQVGVLCAIEDMRQKMSPGDNDNPFKVLTGTSAGGINAAILASHADDYRGGLKILSDVWFNFHAHQVYASDAFGIVRTGARWLTMFSVGWALARWRRAKPKSLLDNEPLRSLLHTVAPMDRIPGHIEAGFLQAVAVTASNYSSGEHVTFYDADHEVKPWKRSQRIAIRDNLMVQHLMASSAIPFVFPAAPLPIMGGVQYFGDGAMRQTAPLSPAIHLGAQRLLVVGASRMTEASSMSGMNDPYPSLAQIAGHALSNIFLDSLAVDIERARRINRTLALMEQHNLAQAELKPIKMLVIAPSKRIDDIASKHVGALPAPIRSMLRAVGVTKKDKPGSGALASYLLFEKPFTQELMALGRSDVEAQAEEIKQFFGW